MNEHDRELLDKQLSGVSSSASTHGGTMTLAFVACFLGGLLIGGILFPHKSSQIQVTTGDAPTTISLLNNSQTSLQ